MCNWRDTESYIHHFERWRGTRVVFEESIIIRIDGRGVCEHLRLRLWQVATAAPAAGATAAAAAATTADVHVDADAGMARVHTVAASLEEQRVRSVDGVEAHRLIHELDQRIPVYLSPGGCSCDKRTTPLVTHAHSQRPRRWHRRTTFKTVWTRASVRIKGTASTRLTLKGATVPRC